MWGYGHGWMMNGEGMGFGFVFWCVILAVIIAGAVWFIRSQSHAGSQLTGRKVFDRKPVDDVGASSE